MTSPSPVSGWEAERERLRKALAAFRDFVEEARASNNKSVKGLWIADFPTATYPDSRSVWNQINAALSESKEQTTADGWMPIETAPKDGTKVLLYSPDRCGNCPPEANGVNTAYWHKDHFWCVGRLSGGRFASVAHEPTLWQPHPTAPVQP